jgi:3-dehydroquinate dehydratase
MKVMKRMMKILILMKLKNKNPDYLDISLSFSTNSNLPVINYKQLINNSKNILSLILYNECFFKKTLE